MRGLRFGICVGLLGFCNCFSEPPTVDATGAVESTDGSSGSAAGSTSGSATSSASTAASMGQTSGSSTLTTGSGTEPADEISLYDLACTENVWWELPLKDPTMLGPDASCGEGLPEPGSVSQAPNRTLVIAPPIGKPGVISGAYFGLDLSGFSNPALQLSFACSLGPTCAFGWTLEIYDPLTQADIALLSGSQNTPNPLEEIMVPLEGYSIVELVLTVRKGDPLGPGSDHAVLVDPRIIDFG